MTASTLGLIVLCVVVIGVIVFGALHDRASNRARAAEMLAPPKRTIPQLAATAPSPRYVSDLQARRPPATPRTGLGDAERATVTAQLAAAGTLTVAVGSASKDFITDLPSGWCVLDEPVVLVCWDAVESIRELLPVLERTRAAHAPLVVVAPEFGPDVLGTLEVNALRGLPLLAVRAQHNDLATLAQRAGAQPTERTDRQSGYLPADQLGRTLRWVSTSTSSHLISDETSS